MTALERYVRTVADRMCLRDYEFTVVARDDVAVSRLECEGFFESRLTIAINAKVWDGLSADNAERSSCTSFAT